MARWKKQLPYEGTIHQGCLNCPPVEQVADMNMLIAVGFGCAMVTRGKKVVYMEGPNDEDYRKLSEFEAMAVADPNHDWRVTLEAPLRGRVYQRHDVAKWVLIESNMGFA